MKVIERDDGGVSGYLKSTFDVSANLSKTEDIKGVINLTADSAYSGDYSRLRNRPSVNGHELKEGENSLLSIGLGLARFSQIDSLFRT